MQKSTRFGFSFTKFVSRLYFFPKHTNCPALSANLFFCIAVLIAGVGTANGQTATETRTILASSNLSGLYLSGSTNGETKNDGDMLNLSNTAGASRGWATFDLSGLPAGAVISNAKVIFTVYTITRSGQINEIHGFTGSPASLSPLDLYNAIGAPETGLILNQYAWTVDPAKNIIDLGNIGSPATNYLQTNIASNAVNLGFVRAKKAETVFELEITYSFPTAPPSCPAPGSSSPTDGANLVPVNGKITWLPTLSATAYDVYLGTSPDPELVKSITDGSVAYSFDPQLATNTRYYYKIVPKNLKGDAEGCQILSFTTSPLPVYCVPASTDCSQDDDIKNVTFSTLNNNGSLCNSDGYTDYSATVPAPVIPTAQTLPISVTVGAGGTEYAGVWIDFNKNGVFENTEFTSLGGAVGSTLTGNIVIPANAATGFTKMRVRVKYNVALTGDDACAAYIGFNNGETEDYTLNFTSCTFPVITAISPDTTICEGSKISLVVKQGKLNNATAWKWYTGSCGGTLAGTGDTLKITPNSTAVYYVRGEGGCAPALECDSIKVTVNEIPFAPAVVPVGSICKDSVLLLEAAGSLIPGPGTLVLNSLDTGKALIPDGTATGLTSTLTSSIVFGAVINSIKVKLNLTHTYPGDMIINLKAPNGKILNLYKYNTAQGTGTVAVDGGWFNALITSSDTTTFRYVPTPFQYGRPPLPGPYRPDAYNTTIATVTVQNPAGFTSDATSFSDLYSVVSGDWTLAMADGAAVDSGYFKNWSLTIDYFVPKGYPVVWTPASSLFTDKNATQAYDGITPLYKVYAKPGTTTTYKATAVNGPCTSPTATNVLVTVNEPISNVKAPSGTRVCEFTSAQFVTSAQGTSPAYQWQINKGDGLFTNLGNDDNYSGTKKDTLKIIGAPFAWNGYRYRCKVTSLTPCTTIDSSAAAVLTIDPTPVVALKAFPYTHLLPALKTTISVSSAPAAKSYTWYRNDSLLTDITGATFEADIDHLGDYKVTVVDVNGCTSTSPVLSIADSATQNLFVYPNPNTGRFQVRYHSAAGNVLPRILILYDSKGALVFRKTYTIGKSYDKMDVNLYGFSKGVYFLHLLDANGKRIANTKLIVQ
jgi:subtilisin-like proprotein convertase family protein